MATVRASIARAAIVAAVTCAGWMPVHNAAAQTDVTSASTIPLLKGFQNPPKSAKPSVYYILLNGYANLDYVGHELGQLADMGIGGLCVFDMGARGLKEAFPPVGPAFMSDEWIESFVHIVQQAAELDMDVQFAVSSSWDMGASWVKPQDASMALYHSSLPVEGPSELDKVLPLPASPAKSPRDEQGKPLFLRDIAVLAFPESQTDHAGEAELAIEDADSILNLTDHLETGGRLSWKVPPGKWTIVRFVCANTGELLKVPSPASDGLATDHFSKQATRRYIRYLTDRLEERLGDLRKSPLKQLYLPSYEVRGAIWTPEFVERFREYRGYDPTPYLPALIGYTIKDKDFTDRFVYDFRKTLGDLLVDAYYRTASECARRVGLGIEAEAGGPGPPVHQVPVDALKALGAIDEVRGEFWPWRTDRDNLWVVKETACAAHIYGRQRVHMEAFTGFRHWEDGPFDIKPSADRAFCEGMNHVVWHTSCHQPPEAGKPGWVYGAGTHLTPNLVWWPMARPFIEYLSRCSFMLQQGLFVADVCYYYGDQGFNFVPPKHIDPSLGYGYDYDVINAEVILNRMTVDRGRIVLPDGMRYEMLILPNRQDIDLQVLERIADLVKAGATVVGPKPTRSTGLTGYPDYDRQVRRLADSLWADCDGKTVLEHRWAKGRIVWGRPPRLILQGRGVGPDFHYTRKGDDTDLDYIHRNTPEADIYFIRNRTMRSESVNAYFRVSDKVPELWFPDSGRTVELLVYEQTAQGIRVPLQFGPADSLLVVFRKFDDQPHLISADSGLTVTDVTDSEVRVTAFKNGSYQMKTYDGRTAGFAVDDILPEMRLTGPWKVSFAPGWGAPDSVPFAELKSWTEHENPGIRYFSGIARYEKEFEIRREWFRDNSRLYLDLGRLWCIGRVLLNGQSLDVVWKPPYRVDVTKAAKPGSNKLAVEIANTWANRLVGDARLPEGQRRCRTNITRSGTPGKPWREIPLRESGLLGPVRLAMAVEKTVALPADDSSR
ncbi:MAG: hypothetical protein JSU70_11590 [Phycisphaerales bacterium]|nr:MAG: hypothetical protein JSU70_11590 [Phycisphaerales bacterium]